MTASEMRMSDWSSDVCSSDLLSRYRNSCIYAETAPFARHCHRVAERVSLLPARLDDGGWGHLRSACHASYDGERDALARNMASAGRRIVSARKQSDHAR